MSDINVIDSSCLSPLLKELIIPVDVWLAGGCIRDSIVGKEIADIDVFSDSYEGLREFMSVNGLLIEGSYTEYPLAIHLEYKGMKVQLIKRYYDNINHMLNSFDYTLCQFAYDGTNIIHTNSGMYDVERNTIRVAKIQSGCELDSMRRLIKYSMKGYFAPVETLREVAEALRLADNLDEQVEYYPNGEQRC